MIDFTNQDTFVQDALAEARRVRASKPAAPPPEPQSLDALDPKKREIVRAIVEGNASEQKLGAEIGKRAVTRGNAAVQAFEPMAAKVRPEYQDLVRGVLYTEGSKPPAKTFGSAAGSDLAQKIPLVGSVVSGFNAIDLLDTAKKLQRGESTDEDIQSLADTYEKNIAHEGYGAKVGGILSELPGTWVDFLLTHGIAAKFLSKSAKTAVGKAVAGAVERSAAKAGETAAAKAVEKATSRMIQRGILKAAPLAAAEGAAKYAQAGAPKLVEPGIKLAAGALTKSAIQTALMSGRAVRSGVERELGDKLEISQDDLGRAQVAINESIGSLVEVLPEGLIDQWIENLSERAGPAIDAIPPLDRLGILSTRLVQKIAGQKGKPIADIITRLGREGGFHGMVSEFGEERFGDLARAAILGDPLELSGTQALAELTAFAVPGAAGAVTARAFGRKPPRAGSRPGAEIPPPSGKPGEAVAQEFSEKPGSAQFQGSSEAVEVEPPEEDAKAWAKAQKAGAPKDGRLQAPRTDEQRAAAEVLRGAGVRAYFVARAPADIGTAQEGPTNAAEATEGATARATEPDDGFQGVVVGNAAFLADDLPEGGAVRWVANHELVHVLEKRQGKGKVFRGLAAAVEHFPELKERAYNAFLGAEAAAAAGPEATDEQFLGAAGKVAGDKALVTSEVPAYAVELMGDLIEAAASNPKAAVAAARADPGFWKGLLDAVYRVVNKFGARIDLHGHKVALDWVRAHSSMPWHLESTTPEDLAAFALYANHALRSLAVPAHERPDAPPARKAAAANQAPAGAPRTGIDQDRLKSTENDRAARAPAAQQPRATTQQPVVARSNPFGGAPAEDVETPQGEVNRKVADRLRALSRIQTRYQGNKREALDKQADALSTLYADDVETVFDFYAGGGTYGLTLVAAGMAPNAKLVVVNEVDSVRRRKFELARDTGGALMDVWETNPLLIEIRAAIAPLYETVDSRSPAALAIDVVRGEKESDRYSEFLRFRDRLRKESVEVQAALLALRDVMFSGRSATLDRAFATATEDGDRVRRLVASVKAKGVKIEVTAINAFGEEAIARVNGSKGRSLVILDPPYHGTNAGTYSADGQVYKFGSNEELQANMSAAARMAGQNVLLYHNKATPGVASAAREHFGGRMSATEWTRGKGNVEFLGIYDGRKQGGNARDVVRSGGVAEGARQQGGRPGVVGEAGSDSRGESERGAARDDRGAGRRAGASPAELEAAAKRLAGPDRAAVATNIPLVPESTAEFNRQHEESLKGLTPAQRKKGRRVVQVERRRLVEESRAFPKQVGDRVRLTGEERVGKVVDVTGPSAARRARVRFPEVLNADRTIKTPEREEIIAAKRLVLVERPGQTTRQAQKNAAKAERDVRDDRARFSRRVPRTAAFRKWFEGSKVVDADGKPLVVYHGTSVPEPFTVFGRRAWFAEAPEEANNYTGASGIAGVEPMGKGRARMYSAYLSIKNPARVHGLLPREIPKLEKQGYDGAYIAGHYGMPGVWVAFSPTQIKSATGNRGTFDASNPDIRFSRAPIAGRAKPDRLGLYSALEDVILLKMPAKASADQVRSIVTAGGVKKEELEWVGLLKFLEGKDTVTRDEVVDFIRSHDVGLTEKHLESRGRTQNVLGTRPEFDLRRVREEDGRREQKHVLAINDWGLFDQEGVAIVVVPAQQAATYEEALQGTREPLEEVGEDPGDFLVFSHTGPGADSTAYGQYQLAGKSFDYRNILFHLPRRYMPRIEWSGPVEREIMVEGRRRETVQEWTSTDGTEARIRTDSKRGFVLNSANMQSAGFDSLRSAQVGYQAYYDKGENNKANFNAPHFRPNNEQLLAHMRVNERVPLDDTPGTLRSGGDTMLFAEEVQSDWHQTGQGDGGAYDTPEERAKNAASAMSVNEKYVEMTELADHLSRVHDKNTESYAYMVLHSLLLEDLAKANTSTPEGKKLWVDTNRLHNAIQEYKAAYAKHEKVQRRKLVPLAPFRNWHELVMKRLIAYAVERGNDMVGWTTGKQQIDRWTDAVRKSVKRIATHKDGDRVVVHAFDHSGGRVFAENMALAPDEPTTINGEDYTLQQIVGAEIAKKVRESPDEFLDFEGDDLTIGGEFHKTLMDKKLVQVANAIGKKYGVQVRKAKLDTRQKRDDEQRVPRRQPSTQEVWALDIPPEMAETIKLVGFPRFSRRLTKSQRERVERMKAASGRAFNQGEETEVGTEPAPIASTSDNPVIRAFQRGVREERSDDHETRHIEDAIDEAEAELEQNPDRAAKRVMDKARDGAGLNDVETHILDTLWKRSAEKWSRTQFTTDYVRAAELNELYQMARRTASLALSTIRDANMTAADRVMEIITTPGRAVGKQIRLLQKARRSMSRDDPRLARVQERLDKLLAQEAERAKLAMQDAKAAGLDPATVTEDYFADPYVLARFGSKQAARKSSGWDWFIELRVADMLSGPTTQIANIAGNAGHIAFDQVARRFAEAMANTVAGDKDSPTFRENAEFARALPTALGNAARNWFMAYATETPTYERDLAARGVTIDGPAARDDIGPKIPGLFGRLLRLPSLTTLLAFDEFFKTLSGEMELRALAYRTAKAKGIAHPSVEDVDLILQTDIAEIGAQALNVARRALFQERTPLMQTLVKLRRDFDDALPGPVGSILFPFIQTPAQIFARALEVPFSIPVALVRMARGKYKDNPRLRVQDSAQIAMSLGIGFAVMQMVGGDDDGPWITGSRSSNFDKADLQQRTAPPNSIKLYGKWYSYARVEPFATILATLVDEVNAVHAANKAPDASIGNTGLAAFGTLVSSLYDQAGDKTFLRTIGDLMKIREEMHRGEGKPGKQTIRYIRDTMVTPMIPFSALLRQVTGADEPEVRANTLRQTDDQGLWTSAAVSVWEGTVQRDGSKPPPKLDLWGRAIKKDGRSYLGRLVGVVKESGSPADVMDLDRLIVRWNDRVASGEVIGPDAKPWYPSPPEYAYDDKKTGRHYWSHQDYAALCERSGKLAAERLAGRTLNYETPTERDIDTMKRVISDARASVKKQLLREGRE